MDAYRDSLRRHLRPIFAIEEECSDMPVSIFDDSLKPVLEFIEEDFQGECHALYHFDGKWFVIDENYGSCSSCDPWMDVSTQEHQWHIEHIIKGLEPVENLWEIPASDYHCPEWKRLLRDFLVQHDVLDKFDEANQTRREQAHESHFSWCCRKLSAAASEVYQGAKKKPPVIINRLVFKNEFSHDVFYKTFHHGDVGTRERIRTIVEDHLKPYLKHLECAGKVVEINHAPYMVMLEKGTTS